MDYLGDHEFGFKLRFLFVHWNSKARATNSSLPPTKRSPVVRTRSPHKFGRRAFRSRSLANRESGRQTSFRADNDSPLMLEVGLFSNELIQKFG